MLIPSWKLNSILYQARVQVKKLFIYRMMYENEKSFFGKNSLNVPNVELFSIFFFNVFSFSMHFCWEWHLLLYILSDFPGLRNLSSLNDLNSLNNLSGLNDLYSLISSKKLLSLMFPSTLTPKWPILVS